MSLQNRKFALAVRQALLMMVDAIEELLDIHPRTSVLRKLAKRADGV